MLREEIRLIDFGQALPGETAKAGGDRVEAFEHEPKHGPLDFQPTISLWTGRWTSVMAVEVTNATEVHLAEQHVSVALNVENVAGTARIGGGRPRCQLVTGSRAR